jgi:hypothetical protein
MDRFLVVHVHGSVEVRSAKTDFVVSAFTTSSAAAASSATAASQLKSAASSATAASQFMFAAFFSFAATSSTAAVMASDFDSTAEPDDRSPRTMTVLFKSSSSFQQAAGGATAASSLRENPDRPERGNRQNLKRKVLISCVSEWSYLQ